MDSFKKGPGFRPQFRPEPQKGDRLPGQGPQLPTPQRPGQVPFARPMPHLQPEKGPGQKEEQEQAQKQLTGEGRIGAEDVGPEELRSMGSIFACRHLLTLMAKHRAQRQEAITQLGELLYELADPKYSLRLITEMLEFGRIVDIYPLELMDYLVERYPDYLPGVARSELVLNRKFLTSRIFSVEEEVPLKLSLNTKLKAFAIKGGGSPGYHLYPGPPGQYTIEFGEPGSFQILLRGEQRKRMLVDTLSINID